MRRLSVFSAAVALSAIWLAASPSSLFAIELGWSEFGCLLKGTCADVPCPQSCDQCTHEHCIKRVPVRECVTGKKMVFEAKMCHECVAIPETRYKWVTKLVHEEIPCCCCMPTCKTTDVPHCFESEEWTKYGFGTCGGCGGLYCKTCQNRAENLPCKQCGRKHGQTTIKVCYKSCVREPYIVYRQVKIPVCVKQPHYEKVQVPITRYVCEHCDGGGCGHCARGGCNHCDGAGCQQCCQ